MARAAANDGGWSTWHEQQRRSMQQRSPVDDPAFERDRAFVLFLYERGAKWREISDATRFPVPHCKRIVELEMENPRFRQLPKEVQAAYFDRALMDLLHLHLETAKDPGWLSDVKGDLVKGPDGLPQLNREERTKAGLAALKTISELQKLHGTYAPTQRYLTIADNRIDAEVKQALASLLPKALPAADVVEADVVEEACDDEQDNEPAGPARRLLDPAVYTAKAER